MQALIARQGWIVVAAGLLAQILIAWNADGLLHFFSAKPPITGPQLAWLTGLVLVFAGVLVAGLATNGRWSGAFIDSRNRYSISQVQAVMWLVVIASGIVAAAVGNVFAHTPSPLDLSIPPELLAIIGLSVTTLVGTPVIRDVKRGQTPNPEQKERTLESLGRTDATTAGSLVTFAQPDQTGWADLIRGEETGNANKVDLGKLQLLYISAVVIFVYGAAMFANLGLKADGSEITPLVFPAIDASFVGLLGLSHAGALAYLAAPHTDTNPTPVA